MTYFPATLVKSGSCADTVNMESLGTAVELMKLAESDEDALVMLDKMLTYFSSLDRRATIGSVVDEWLDVRIDLRKLDHGTVRPLEGAASG